MVGCLFGERANLQQKEGEMYVCLTVKGSESNNGIKTTENGLLCLNYKRQGPG